MKASTTISLLLLIGVVAVLIYGYNRGWFKASGPVPVTTPVATPVTSGGEQVIDSNTTVINNPDSVELNHTDEGFVLIPIDSSGNVVQPNRAVQFIKYSSLGQDCNVQYRDRIYFIQPRRRWFPQYHTTPPTT